MIAHRRAAVDSKTRQVQDMLRRVAGTRAAWLAAVLAAVALWQAPALSAESAVKLPPPAVDAPSASATETVVLAGGCFWGVQGVFQHTRGVIRAVSGYSGGARDTARYEVIGSGTTGHAESVEVTFDPKQISYGKILQIFFSVVHDPTQLNRQGPDTGSQYRSAIFHTSEAQKRAAEAYIAQLDKAKLFRGPIVTQNVPLTAFYRAEDYHQDYATLHPSQPYIYTNDLPKIENLKKMFPEFYRDKPVLVANAPGKN
jgi:peptide-methionine (S)-S-oxide reductase